MEDFWAPSKRLLGDIQFLQKLKDFDKDNIPQDRMAKIRASYLTDKNFQPSIVAKASRAARGMCKWIIALDKYEVVMKAVAPKKAVLAKAEAEYRAVLEKLHEKQAILEGLRQKLAALKAEKEEADLKQLKLIGELDICSMKLEKAVFIIGSLGGEQVRWKQLQTENQKKLDNVPGDVLIGSGMIAYLGPLSSEFREPLISDWLKKLEELNVPCNRDFKFRLVLGTELAHMRWVMDGLPNDPFSIDNAVILDTSPKYCLLIDPQSQANKWIKKSFSDNINVTRLSRNYMPLVSEAIQLGKTLLLEDVEETIDTALQPLIKQQYFREGSFKFLALGDNVLIVHDDFRFYISSKLTNPSFLPEIFNDLNVINFSLTTEGLTDQVLSMIIALKHPDLDQKRKTLVAEGASNKELLGQCEMEILTCLQHKDLLTHPDTVEILERSKKTAEGLKTKEAESQKAKLEIDNLKRSYRIVAYRTSYMYYTVVDLPAIDPMYQFSLEWFLNIYEDVIQRCMLIENLKTEQFLETLENDFHLSLFKNVVTSLFNKDKILYSFVFLTTSMHAEGILNMAELDFLMTGGVQLGDSIPNMAESWLPATSWNEICRVDSLVVFGGFFNHFINNLVEWEHFTSLDTPSFNDIPNPWKRDLSLFQQLIIFRMLRQDQLIAVINDFIEIELGNEFVDIPPLDLGETIKNCRPLTPVIFVLSAGADPLKSLLELAADSNACFMTISLGQGQGPIAEEMLRTHLAPSSWICLQNCHLLASWMPSLEAICEDLPHGKDEKSLSGFRLFLTSYPSDKFPVTILQSGIKIINEAPAGLRNSLLKCYTSPPVSDLNFYYSCEDKHEIFSRLLLGISFFHAIVLERRTYGPIGWNIPYGFNDSDYLISINQLEIFISKYSDIPYNAVMYLTGECNYGGRVTDNWDRRTLNTLLKDFINHDVIYNLEFSVCPGDTRFQFPTSDKYNDVLNFIRNLPEEVPAQVYGLHPNAGIARDIMNMRMLQNSLLKVLRTSSARGTSGDDKLNDIVSEVLGKLPVRFDVGRALSVYPTIYSESMNTVLVQEMDKFNRLLDCIKSSLQGLIKALKGEIVMTGELESLSKSILMSQIPSLWSKVSYPSLKPLGSYIKDLVDRLNFLQNWFHQGKPESFWLSGFFFTQAFLTGALQNFARKYKIPIDFLTFDFKIYREGEFHGAPEDGVAVYGLYLVGARWDRESDTLEEQYFKVLYDELPLLWIKPMKRDQLKEGTRYLCPLYKTSERKGILSTTGHSTNYVLPILLETYIHPDHWIRRGVACLCQLDD